MNKKIIMLVMTIAIILVMSISMVACNMYEASDFEYYFSSYEKNFVKYDDSLNEGKGNLENSGSYWNMEVKEDVKIDIYIVTDALSMYSGLEFKVNDKQVKSEVDTGIYTYVYKNLDLKKGDKLSFHGFWVNSLMTNDTGFNMTVFAIKNGGETYAFDDVR